MTSPHDWKTRPSWSQDEDRSNSWVCLLGSVLLFGVLARVLVNLRKGRS